MLDIVGGANRDGYPFTGDLNLEALLVFQSIGKPPELFDEVWQWLAFFDIVIGLVSHFSSNAARAGLGSQSAIPGSVLLSQTSQASAGSTGKFS